jgi:hypothetical protein
MIEIKSPGPKISPTDIDKIEGAFRRPFTEQYRIFLLDNNGGIPKPNIIDIRGLPGSPTDVQVFFGIGRSAETSNIEWSVKNIGAEPCYSDLVPIARDGGGERFYLSVRPDTYGYVFYCDATGLYARDDQSLPKFYTVSFTFDEFLKSIRS